MIQAFLSLVQLFFTVIIGLYFLELVRGRQNNKSSLEKQAKREIGKLIKIREIKLTEPLSEKTRPETLNDIVGQAKGLKLLRAALCGPNPQHVIIYGPPGTGKTAAARVVLEEAKRMAQSPFSFHAKFVEIDATTLRFDERGIADPLMGSVHDPIYQGAGAYGAAGIPQPKAGAVTKAHGGILFIDEIGELPSIQINKLLKVLEDRKVFFESSYYCPDDKNIPRHIHDIFQNGLPADFRLVGATTRMPEDIPPAIRSRCVEIYFDYLTPVNIMKIAKFALYKGNFKFSEGVLELIGKYAKDGRDAVNIAQISGSVAQIEGRRTIYEEDIKWIAEYSHFSPRYEKKAVKGYNVGVVNGLAVYGNGVGTIIEIEARAEKNKLGKGSLTVTGIVEEEETSKNGHKLKNTSFARASVKNVMTVLDNLANIDCCQYDIHINFPGGVPVDGPSAGIAIAVAVYSAVKNIPVKGDVAMSGEISIMGKVKPVGGICFKVDAAKNFGIKTVIIPKDNLEEVYEKKDLRIFGVEDIFEVLRLVFDEREMEIEANMVDSQLPNILTASRI